MSYSFDYTQVQPEFISISLGKEAQMPNTKTGGLIAYKTGELLYSINGAKHKLIVKGPECKSKSGLYINKDDEETLAPQAYQQPMINGYQNQQMFNPGAMAPKKFKKKISSTVPIELQPNVNPEHNVFVNKLNTANKIVNDRLFEIKNMIYSSQAIKDQQIANKPLVSYPVNHVTSEADLEANPTIWLQVKKYEDQMNKIFLMPNKTYASYKDLIGVTFSGIPIFSFSMFFNQLNKTCKLNLEGFMVTNIEVSAVANELLSICDQYNELDPEMANRVSETLKKINESKCKVEEPSKESSGPEPGTITDLPVSMPPQSIVNPQTYQMPQTPMQQQYQMPQTYQQPTPNHFLR